MVRLGAALFCIVSVGCFGQDSDLARQLASGNPKDVAWAAYTIGVQQRFDLVPKLVALVASFDGGATEDKTRIPPEAAVMEAVADALIRLEAKLPGYVVMHLYPRFPAQTIILLSRASDNIGPLMKIFQSTRARDLWLAAGNLLAVHPPAGFVRVLLSGAITTFSFQVMSADTKSDDFGGGGCEGDFIMLDDENFLDWPRARMYRLIHQHIPSSLPFPTNVFAPGIHSVSFSWWETTDYRDPWEDGSGCEWESEYWRKGLIAQLLGEKISDLRLQPTIDERVLFTSTAAFAKRVKNAIEPMSRAYKEVVGAFVQNGELTRKDSATLHFQCRIEVADKRPSPHAELTDLDGKWCVAPSAEVNFQLP